MTTAAAILSRVKSDDDLNIGVVTLMRSDSLYMRLAAAWPNVARMIPQPSFTEQVPAEIGEELHLRWLWAGINPAPEPLWAQVAGLPDAAHVRRAMQVLQDNCVVFPDGNMSKWAIKYLEASAEKVGVAQDDSSDT